MANEDFSEWLLAELDKRGWAQTLLAERANISDTQLSRLMRRERQPGIDAIKGIARAFGIPVETVMRAAGWLPAIGEQPEGWYELGTRVMALSPEFSVARGSCICPEDMIHLTYAERGHRSYHRNSGTMAPARGRSSFGVRR